jgi:1,4-alpha-glucan branching enzyme
MEKGYISLVLHAHLPFIREPDYDDFLEERWFFEAITDTYIPLLIAFDRLMSEGVPFRITMDISPSLAAMMQDELLCERFDRHLDKMIRLCDKELERTRFMPEYYRLAQMYHARFTQAKDLFNNRWQRSLIGAFRHVQNAGFLEIITCGATHGFLPLLNVHEESVRAQVRTGVDSYRRSFGRNPPGIWLPECAYYENMDKYLAEEGIKYFLLETHGILFARPRPKYGVYAPYYTKNKVAVFGRDAESSKSVWSSKEGYPGDHNYREYYRDVGFDLDWEYVKDFIAPTGDRVFTGIKYHRITGHTDNKQPYDPDKADEMAAMHAGNFLFNREKQIEYLSSVFDRQPIIVSPYDAELFGHWWYEGVNFLYYFFKKIHFDQQTVKPITPTEYLNKYPRNQVIAPSPSTWGHKGYAEVWLNNGNDWIYPHLHKAAELMINLSKHAQPDTALKYRILNQMAREMLLAQSSDWPFIMTMGTFVEFAANRVVGHLENFYTLYNQYISQQPQERVVKLVEQKNTIFPGIDFRVFS